MTARELISGAAVVVVAMTCVCACAVADELAPLLATVAALVLLIWVFRPPRPFNAAS